MEISEMQAETRIDSLVAKYVMGWHSRKWNNEGYAWIDNGGVYMAARIDPDRLNPRWSPSTNVSDAWQVVEHMTHKGAVNINHWDGNTCEDTIWNVLFAAPHYRGEASCHTVELAICRAALRAIDDLNQHERRHQKEAQP